MEAPIGPIQGEFDEEATQIIRSSENVWEVSGTLPLHDFEKIKCSVHHDEAVAATSGLAAFRK